MFVSKSRFLCLKVPHRATGAHWADRSRPGAARVPQRRAAGAAAGAARGDRGAVADVAQHLRRNELVLQVTVEVH